MAGPARETNQALVLTDTATNPPTVWRATPPEAGEIENIDMDGAWLRTADGRLILCPWEKTSR